jgi:hypothetical protein
MNAQQQNISRLLKSIEPHVPQQAWSSTVAIVIVDRPRALNYRPRLLHYGSGILFRVADDSFVVTAAHVITEARKRSNTLGFSSVTGFVAPINQWFVSAQGQLGADGDAFDIAACKLSKNEVEKLTGKTFVSVEDLELGPHSPSAVYSLFGFPGIWSKPIGSDSDGLQLKPFQFTTYAYAGQTLSLSGYQEDTHLLLDAELSTTFEYDGSQARFQDTQGNHADFPVSLTGISGCSVWRIGDWDVPPESWHRIQPRMVAVVTSARPSEKAIQATRWSAICSVIS